MSRIRVGLLIDTFEDLCEHEICKGVFEYFSSVGIHIILFEGAYNFRSIDAEDQYIKTAQMIKNSDLSGIIIFSTFFLDHIGETSLLKYIESISNIPLVSIGLEIPGVSSISISEERAISELVDYLVNKEKHKNFAFMFGPDSDDTSKSRLESYKKYLKKNKVTITENKIYKLETTNYYDAKLKSKDLLSKCITMPEVIICYDDYTALGVVNYLEDEGFSVPFDIKVTGFDSIPIDNPSKTKIITVKQPFKEAGFEAAKVLSQMIETRDFSINKKLNCKIINNDAVLVYNRLLDDGIESDFDLSNITSIEYAKEIIQSVIERITVSNSKTKESLLDIFYTMTIDEFIEDPLSLGKHLKSYLKGSSVDSISEVRHILDTGLQIIYNNYGVGTLIYRIFSTSLHAVNEYLLNSLVSESYIREDFYWREAVGSQVILRSETFDELINSLPVYTNEFQCKDFYLFLYKYDHITESRRGELPGKTKLVYSMKEEVSTPEIFNTKNILPDWNLISKDQNYIIIMLFYNDYPIGYMFIDYSPGIDPKKYSAMRINLETAIFNIIKLEEEKESWSKLKDYYIKSFTEINDIQQELINNYSSITQKGSTSDSLLKLGNNLKNLSRKITDSYKMEEDPLSFDHKESCSLESFLSNYSIDCSTDKVIRFDPLALDIVLKYLEKLLRSPKDINILTKEKVILQLFYTDILANEEKVEVDRIRDILKGGDGEIKISTQKNGTLITMCFLEYKNPIITRDEKDKTDFIIIFIDRDQRIIESLDINFRMSYYQSIFSFDSRYYPQNLIILSRFPDLREDHYREKTDKYRLLMDNGVPVVFFSSRKSLKEKWKALEMGAIDYLEIPFSSRFLSIKLKSIFAMVSNNKKRYIALIEKTLQGVLQSESLYFDIEKNKAIEILKSSYNLNHREIEIAMLLFNKNTHREISSKVNLTEQSVRNISHKIYKKCQVKCKKELLNLIESTTL